jgi:CRP-like cAMP-binding protein
MTRLSHSSNRFLAALTHSDAEAIMPHLDTLELPQETVLFEDGDPIGRVYFPHTGIVSLLVDLASGEMIETAMIGRDSVVGGLSALDGTLALNRAVVQIAGTASVLPAERLREVAGQSIELRTTLLRHGQAVLAQSQQTAACNATHSVEARLARWLLRCRDLVDGDDIQLTQEFLAQMLGVRRTSVTIIANTFQTAGLIGYKRGHIRIRDLEGLKESACECYETLRSQTDRLLRPAPAIT